MKKKVLIALDYDPSAQKVAEVGYSLAKTMGAEAILFHVIADSTYYSSTEHVTIMGFAGYMDMVPMQLDCHEGLKKTAQHFLDQSKHHLGNEAIITMIAEGDISESILKVSNDIHSNLIVMGSHSRRWLENIVIGSVTKTVLLQTLIPLFIIPTRRLERK